MSFNVNPQFIAAHIESLRHVDPRHHPVINDIFHGQMPKYAEVEALTKETFLNVAEQIGQAFKGMTHFAGLHDAHSIESQTVGISTRPNGPARTV